MQLMSIVQKLVAGGYEHQHNFACLMQVILRDNENAVIFRSDETNFHLSGEVTFTPEVTCVCILTNYANKRSEERYERRGSYN